MPKYLTLSEAQSKLSLENISFENINLDSIISQIEELIEVELDREFGVKEYVEILQSNYYGNIFLTHEPVKTVLTVEWVFHNIVEQTEEAIAARRDGETPNQLIEDTFIWDEGNKIKVSANNSYYRVSYLAGLAPPNLLINAIYDILKLHIMNQEVSLGWLYQPTQDRTSLSIPGGISGSVKLSDTGDKTQLDRLLSPLKKKYQKSSFKF